MLLIESVTGIYIKWFVFLPEVLSVCVTPRE